MYLGLLGEMVDSRNREEIHKMILENLLVPESKEVFKKNNKKLIIGVCPWDKRTN